MKSRYTIPHPWIPENLDFSRPPLRNEECWYWWIYVVGFYSRFSKSSPLDWAQCGCIIYPCLARWCSSWIWISLWFIIHLIPWIKTGFRWCLNRRCCANWIQMHFGCLHNTEVQVWVWPALCLRTFFKHNYPQGFVLFSASAGRSAQVE